MRGSRFCCLLIGLLAMVTLLGACASASTPTPFVAVPTMTEPATVAATTPPVVLTPAQTPSPRSATAAAIGSSTFVPAATPSSGVPQELPQMALRAKEDLARRLGEDPISILPKIEITSVTITEWSDVSLDCPQAEESYTQAAIPGFRLVLQFDGKSYEYHTDKVATVVYCEAGAATPIPAIEQTPPPTLQPGGASVSAEAQPVVERAVQELARITGRPLADLRAGVRVYAFDETEWPDAGLGCPQPGKTYAQVTTPGYKITLTIPGVKMYYVFHADKVGNVVYCTY